MVKSFTPTSEFYGFSRRSGCVVQPDLGNLPLLRVILASIVMSGSIEEPDLRVKEIGRLWRNGGMCFG